MATSLTPDPTGNTSDDDLVLFDVIAFRIFHRRKGTGCNARKRLILATLGSGLLRSDPGLTGPLKLHVKTDVRAGIIATMKVNLYARDLEDGVIFTSGSTASMNLQHVVRAKHQTPSSHIGLDRQRNFSKPTAECDDDDLALQFDAIYLCIEMLIETISASLPGSIDVEGRLLLRNGEVCHDLACTNAEEIARATCRVPPSGSRESWQREYACTEGSGRSPTWHVAKTKRGPVMKGYVKAAWLPRLAEPVYLLRTEASCPTYDAVVKLMGERISAPFSAAGAVDLAWSFYNAAGALCCEALDHVREVAAGMQTVEELLIALDPIKAIAERDRIGDGYRPNDRTAAAARRILQGLLRDGLVHAVGLRKGTKVRDALEALAMHGGPLVRGASPGIYCLAARYGLALPRWQGQFPLVLRG